jgi:hypothetical protein
MGIRKVQYTVRHRMTTEALGVIDVKFDYKDDIRETRSLHRVASRMCKVMTERNNRQYELQPFPGGYAIWAPGEEVRLEVRRNEP